MNQPPKFDILEPKARNFCGVLCHVNKMTSVQGCKCSTEVGSQIGRNPRPKHGARYGSVSMPVEEYENKVTLWQVCQDSWQAVKDLNHGNSSSDKCLDYRLRLRRRDVVM